MREIVLGFQFSLSYFTSIPAFLKPTYDLTTPKVLKTLVYSLPLVGLVLGLFTLLVWQLLMHLGLAGAIVTSVLSMMLYGYLHTEAIIDVMDAIYAKHSGKDAYKVIKESTVGAVGVLYAVGFVLMKVSLLTALLLNGFYFEIVFVFIISRLCSSVLIASCEFKSTFLDALKKDFNFKDSIILFAIVSLLTILVLGFSYFILILFSILISYILKNILKKSLGFLNGDTLGFNLELVEIILFLTIGLLWL